MSIEFSDLERCVLHVRYIYKCDVFQTADIMGMTPNDIRWIEHLSIEKARKHYKDSSACRTIQ